MGLVTLPPSVPFLVRLLIMPKTRSARPANRPSRRHEILEAATELLSSQPPDEIAVSDIAAHCGMTPAAFYYHFASKDEILDEIVASFATQWRDQVEHALGTVTTADDVAVAVEGLLMWIDEHERASRVYFVTSIGATTNSEAVRRKTRNDLARRAAKIFAKVAPTQDKVRQAISGLGLMTLLEIAARSRLEGDATFRTLGPVGFRAAAGQLAEALV